MTALVCFFCTTLDHTLLCEARLHVWLCLYAHVTQAQRPRMTHLAAVVAVATLQGRRPARAALCVSCFRAYNLQTMMAWDLACMA